MFLGGRMPKSMCKKGYALWNVIPLEYVGCSVSVCYWVSYGTKPGRDDQLIWLISPV